MRGRNKDRVTGVSPLANEEPLVIVETRVDVVWNTRLVRPSKPRGERAHRRVTAAVGERWRLRQRVAGLHGGGVMIAAFPAIHGADQGQPVHDTGLQRQVLAHSEAGDLGVDRPKRTANLDGGTGFGVPRIDVAGTAGEPEENHRSFARCATRRDRPSTALQEGG